MGHHVWRKAAQVEAVEQYEKDAYEVAQWVDEQLPYGVTSKLLGGKRSKEITNELKERALAEKAKQNRKERQLVEANAYEDEYARMKEQLYKSKKI